MFPALTNTKRMVSFSPSFCLLIGCSGLINRVTQIFLRGARSATRWAYLSRRLLRKHGSDEGGRRGSEASLLSCSFLLSSHLGISGEGEAVDDNVRRSGAKHGRVDQLFPLFRCQSHSYHTCRIKRHKVSSWSKYNQHNDVFCWVQSWCNQHVFHLRNITECMSLDWKVWKVMIHQGWLDASSRSWFSCLWCAFCLWSPCEKPAGQTSVLGGRQHRLLSPEPQNHQQTRLQSPAVEGHTTPYRKKNNQTTNKS